MKTLLARKVTNEQMTRKVAAKIVKSYLADCSAFTVFIEGGLGAGKTFLIRAILETLGIDEDIPSPTYTYVQEYTGTKNFAHFDLYRFRTSEQILAKGFGDMLTDESVCKFIEWPERLSPELRALCSGTQFTIKIDHGAGASMRQIELLSRN
jgi:tRNA threonylcarbamoyladenosine biosynthesis protein TsaE